MTKTLAITGMSCGHCVSHVKSALEDLEGVTLATSRTPTSWPPSRPPVTKPRLGSVPLW